MPRPCKQLDQALHLFGKRLVYGWEFMARTSEGLVELLNRRNGEQGLKTNDKGRRSSVRKKSLSWPVRTLAMLQILLLVFSGSPSLMALQFNAGLRSSGSSGGGQGSAPSLQNAGAASAALTATLAKQSLQKSQQVISGLQSAQQAAATAATGTTADGKTVVNGLQLPASSVAANQLPGLVPYYNAQNPAPSGVANIPNGSVPVPGTWSGVGPRTAIFNGQTVVVQPGLQQSTTGSANNPSSATVTINQTQQSAYLYWSHFNVGAQTTVNFTQSGNNGSPGTWIAFNKVMTASDPSHIFGKINAPGQVYILNQGGILFHAGSSVNVQSLVAATLPINQNLAGDHLDKVSGSGIVNFPKGVPQFLFTALDKGSYDPNNTGRVVVGNSLGNVIVEPGASISASSANNSGGLVALIGPNVRNGGVISTPSGQTVLAAGLQVALTPHPATDPSLRGLDVSVGQVAGNNASGAPISVKSVEDGSDITSSLSGTADNTSTGLITANEGNVTIVGSAVRQSGGISSSTSASFNGRVDLLANYGATINPLYTSDGRNGLQFSYSQTGAIDVGPGSSIQILPEWDNGTKTTGTALALSSIVSMLGSSVTMHPGSILLAPGAVATPNAFSQFGTPIGSTPLQAGSGVTIQAGVWDQVLGIVYDPQANGTGVTIASGATIDLSGSTGVQLSSAENFITLQLRAAELANSPLQQSSVVRGKDITIDARVMGTSTIDGVTYSWTGTPLGDVSGYVALIQRTVSELTTAGGTLSILSGGEVNVQQGATLNLSGGWTRYSGGSFSTTLLLNSYGQIVPIAKATPDQIYTAVIHGPSVYEAPYYEGANAGSLSIQGSSVLMNGNLHGNAVAGENQVLTAGSGSKLPSGASLSIGIMGQEWNPSLNSFATVSPTPPRVVFSATDISTPSLLALSPSLFTQNGFSSLSVLNHDGPISIPSGVVLNPGIKGSVSLEAASVDVAGSIIAPGGTVVLKADLANYGVLNALEALKTHQPSDAILDVVDYQGVAYGQYGVDALGQTRIVNSDGSISTITRILPHHEGGIVTLEHDSLVSTAGTLTDASPNSPTRYDPYLLNGGSVSIAGYSVQLEHGSRVDVSAGSRISKPGSVSYGNGGSLAISAGVDPSIKTIHDGALKLGALLVGYGGVGANPGSMALTAPAINVGGQTSDPRILKLGSSFFDQGGFGSFTLSGYGLQPLNSGGGIAPSDTVSGFIPAVEISAGVSVNPIVFSEILTGFGSDMTLTPFLSPGNYSPAPSLVLKGLGVKSQYTQGANWIAPGGIVLDEGSSVILKPQLISKPSLYSYNAGSLTLSGDSVLVAGSVVIPGGSVTISDRGGVAENYSAAPTAPQVTVDIASTALISVASMPLMALANPAFPAVSQGIVPSGGQISISGNVLAESGARLDASGSSAMISLLPGQLNIPIQGGLGLAGSTLTRVSSSGGGISLAGAQFLVSEASLRSAPGGSGVLGGSLTISSGRFYLQPDQLPSDVSMTILGTASAIPGSFSSRGADVLGRFLSNADGSAVGGRIASATFADGGFADFSFKGNVKFTESLNLSSGGNISISDGSFLTLAPGIVVSISAPHVVLGSTPIGPLAPTDGRLSALFGTTYYAPTGGNSELDVHANLIDLGNLIIRGAGTVLLDAGGGVVRGNGTLDMAGSLTINARQVYPASDTIFSIFDYNYKWNTANLADTSNGEAVSSSGGAGIIPGSITINGSGDSTPPLSAAGTLAIYAEQIVQNGTLQAPFGIINLGWNTSLTSPMDPITGAGSGIGGVALSAIPETKSLTLGPGSVTSVSAVDPYTGVAEIIPFGTSADGSSWIDPSGTDITTSGLKTPSVNLGGISVSAQNGSLVDLQGGGSMISKQWISGNGGNRNLVSAPLLQWKNGTPYNQGALVLFKGAVWSARQSNSGVQPTVGTYWTKLPNAYAILPGYDQKFAPLGYADAGLNPGQSIKIPGVGNLLAGNYTLLPADYATLPGAWLVFESVNSIFQGSSFQQPDGVITVTGTLDNQLTGQQSPTSGIYGLLSPAALAARVTFNNLYADSAFSGISTSSRNADGGHLLVSDVSGLDLRGAVTGRGFSSGRGGLIDIATKTTLKISQSSSGNNTLSADILDKWSFGSLLIGGLRTFHTAASISETATTITVDSGTTIQGNDLILAARNGIVLGDNVSIKASGSEALIDPIESVSGNGSIIRVSSDKNAIVTRNGSDWTDLQGVVINQGSLLSGASVTIDSSKESFIESSTLINAGEVNLAAGRIALDFANSPNYSALDLSGNLLSNLCRGGDLNLFSHSTILMNGSPGFPVSFRNLQLHASALLGDNFSNMAMSASVLSVDNAFGASLQGDSFTSSAGSINMNAEILSIGSGNFTIGGFRDTTFSLSVGLLGAGHGGLANSSNLFINTPAISGLGSSVTTLSAGLGLSVNQAVSGASSSLIASGLAASFSLVGNTIALAAPIRLPSGNLSLEALGGDLTVTASVDLSGESEQINGAVIPTSGGVFKAMSDHGNINLAGASVNVSGAGSADAGSVSLTAPFGMISAMPQSLDGDSDGGKKGSFVMDVSMFNNGNNSAQPSDLGTLETALSKANLISSQNLRIRSGDVLVPSGSTARAYAFTLTADAGSIIVNGKINASLVPTKDPYGNTIYTGGSIGLFAGNSVTLGSGAELDVHGTSFNNAGKGGSVDLEAGASTDHTVGIIDTTPRLDGNGRFTAGSVVDLARGIIDLYVGTDPTHQLTPTLGQASGTLHLRAPQTGDASDVQVDPIGATILGASLINIEGFYRQDAATAGTAVIDPGTGVANDYENNAYLNAQSFMANYNSVLTRVLNTTDATTGNYRNVTQLNPGQEIDNSKGGLVLNNIWDLSSSDWRYGPTLTPFDSSGLQIVDPNGSPITTGAWAGYLTLKAQGNITFNGALTDGFGTGINALYDIYSSFYQPGVNPTLTWEDPAATFGNYYGSFTGNGGINYAPLLPLARNSQGILVGQQSWSYVISAGGDPASSDPLAVDMSGLGSVKIGIPNSKGGPNVASSPGINATTASALTDQNGNSYYQVIRTGTGNISISASGDLQLWNQFASIYTAGVLIVDPTMNGTFQVPSTASILDQAKASESLGIPQQAVPYPVQYSLGGGNISVNVHGEITRLTKTKSGVTVADSVREMPSNWLYRVGSVDPDTGTFSVMKNQFFQNGAAQVASTTWWVDFSNFFDDFGALGGGNISLFAGKSIANINASIPTNFRMSGRDSGGNLIQAASASGIELGGGDLIIKAGLNLDGGSYELNAGVFYTERGNSYVNVNGDIVTNETRDPQAPSITRNIPNSQYAYLPTTFFLGKGNISVKASGSILIGPVANEFLTPQGINNSYWFKDYFTTYAPTDSFSVLSMGGNLTLRDYAANEAINKQSIPLLQEWMNQFIARDDTGLISAWQPWLRITEYGIDSTTVNGKVLGLGPLVSLMPSEVNLTSLSGEINISGGITTMPSSKGDISIVARRGVNGLTQTGYITSGAMQVWTAATINLSDADPASLPGVNAPVSQWAYLHNQPYNILFANMGEVQPFTAPISQHLLESGSYSGNQGTLQFKLALHDSIPLHQKDDIPLTIYSGTGDISGLTLFSPKFTQIIAGGNITDIGFYIQNVNAHDVSLVSAGGNIIPYDPTSPLETKIPATAASQFQSGDIQISGPGTLEVLAGGNIDLGNNPGANGDSSIMLGIASIGNQRNPGLPFHGADIVASAGLPLGAGLTSSSSLALDSFAKSVLSTPMGQQYLDDLKFQMDPSNNGAPYAGNLTLAESYTPSDFLEGSETFIGNPELKSLMELQLFYIVLRTTARDHNNSASPNFGSYQIAENAIAKLLNDGSGSGNIITWSQSIASVNGGNIDLFAPYGGITMGSINYKATPPAVAPGIVTQGGGAINVYVRNDLTLGINRIFTLKGGDIMMWSNLGNIAAGASSKTVQSAPPTQVLVDPTSALVEADLAGLATGGGIGTLQTLAGITRSSVDLIAVSGIIDAGDAGIRSSGNLNLAATKILNADNIAVGGLSVGVPPVASSSAPAAAAPAAPAAASAPSSAASTAAAAASNSADKTADKGNSAQQDETPSEYTITIDGYGGSADDEDSKKAANAAVAPVQASL